MNKLFSFCAVAFSVLPLVCIGQTPEGDAPEAQPAVERPAPNNERGMARRGFQGAPNREDRTPGAEGNRRFPGPGPRPMLKFETFDINNDGVIDKEEFKKLQETVMRPPMPPRDGDRPRFDGDRPDGDRPRFDGDRPDGDRPRFDGDRPDGNRPGPKDRPNPNNLFKQLDANQDGVISFEEIPEENARLQELFKRLDVNKDNKVVKSEWKMPSPREGRSNRGEASRRNGSDRESNRSANE